MEKLLVIGGSSGIGLATVKHALEEGLAVRAFSRGADEMELDHPALEKHAGDALNKADVLSGLEGCSAVAQTLGVPLKPETILSGTSLFSKSTKVLLDAMKQADCPRLVAVTGYGAGDSKDELPLWERPAFKLVFERIYADKGEQERLIKESDREWTIVRPTILTDGRPGASYEVQTDPRNYRTGLIARGDVARFVVSAIKEHSYLGQAPVLRGSVAEGLCRMS